MSYDILNDKFVCNICTIIPCQCSEPVKIVPVNNLTSQIQNSVMGSNTSFLTKDEEDEKGNDSGIEDSFPTGSDNEKVKQATVAKTVLQYKSQKNHEKYKFPSKEKEEENLLEKIKESGLAGTISYAAWELAFWAVSVPVCVLGYKEVTG